MRVAVVIRNLSRLLPPKRQHGWWSYPVPEFDFEIFPVEKYERLDRGKFKGFDLIYLEDNKCYAKWEGFGPPIAYKVSDSPLTERHYRERHAYAERSGFETILVDYDDLSRFSDLAAVYRFSYCVNDHMFHDYYGKIKQFDISFLAGKGLGGKQRTRRSLIRQELTRICKKHGLILDMGPRPGYEYARGFSKSKIAVNSIGDGSGVWRNQRFFDAMACRTCVLSDKPKQLEGEDFVPGKHYVDFQEVNELEGKILNLLKTEMWWEIANQGYTYIHKYHNWKARSSYLYTLLSEGDFYS